MENKHALIKCFFSALILACIFPIEFNAQSKNIFVSPSGNDINGGTGINDALATFSKAFTMAAAGDTIFLMPGTFTEKLVADGIKGEPEKPVCIYGMYSAGELMPVIDAGAVSPSLNANYLWMQIGNSQWLELGNIVFKNGWTDPIEIYGSSYITFNNCTFYGGRKVISAEGENTHHLLVENCTWDQGGDYLWNYTEPGGIEAAWTTLHDGSMSYYNGSLIDFSGTGGSVVIRNNKIMNAFNGIRWTAAQDYDSNVEIYGNTVMNIRDNDFEPEYYTFNLFIHHNYSHNIHKTMSVDNVNGGFIYYFGNTITSAKDSWSNQICTGYWKVYGTERNLSFPMYAFNNSFCGVGKVMGSMSGKALQFKHFNNAYYFTGSRTWNLDIWDETDEFDYDISSKTWPSNIVNNNQEAHGIIGDVKFTDPVNFDLNLTSESPAIDAGKIMSLPDLGWTQSYNGSAPDIGAFELNEPADGPAFRFRNSSGLKINYVEKPRITKAEITGQNLMLYFSSPINPLSVSQASIYLKNNGAAVKISGVSFARDYYLLEIETNEKLNPEGLNLQFSPMPKGLNGADATMWASALNDDSGSVITGVEENRDDAVIPSSFELSVYPNPFNPSTTIKYLIPAVETRRGLPTGQAGVSLQATITVYDILGCQVATLVNGVKSAGTYEVKFNAGGLSSGIYFVVLSAEGYINSQKIVLLK